VSLSRDPANHLSRSTGEGQLGAGGTRKFLRGGDSVTQSVSDYLGRLGVGMRVGGARLIVIGIWSEPVEGRETSHDLNRGRILFLGRFSFSFFFFCNHAFIVFRYKKPHAALAMERTKPINQNI